jgi:hypothetical protein
MEKMKYDEYQVWFHAYITGISANVNTLQENRPDDKIIFAERVANKALEVYKNVEKPKMPDLSDVNLDNIVSSVMKGRKI